VKGLSYSEQSGRDHFSAWLLTESSSSGCPAKTPKALKITFNDIEYIPTFDYIINTEIPEKAGILQEPESWQGVGDLEFEMISNEWKLKLYISLMENENILYLLTRVSGFLP